MTSTLDSRPIVVAVAGPNGAGKTTFFEAFLRPAALRFVNADELARDLELEAGPAMELAGSVRRTLLEQRESFVFETVFSDPVGDKLAFLRGAQRLGYTAVLCFIGLDSASLSEERVAMRVLQGGHDVPKAKLVARFPRILKNLQAAIGVLDGVLVFDNSDLARPFRKVAEFRRGKRVFVASSPPAWLKVR